MESQKFTILNHFPGLGKCNVQTLTDYQRIWDDVSNWDGSKRGDLNNRKVRMESGDASEFVFAAAVSKLNEVGVLVRDINRHSGYDTRHQKDDQILRGDLDIRIFDDNLQQDIVLNVDTKAIMWLSRKSAQNLADDVIAFFNLGCNMNWFGIVMNEQVRSWLLARDTAWSDAGTEGIVVKFDEMKRDGLRDFVICEASCPEKYKVLSKLPKLVRRVLIDLQELQPTYVLRNEEDIRIKYRMQAI